MIANNIIQADLVADLKAFTTLTDVLASADEVREDQYQGTVFDYPAVRVAINQQIYRDNSDQCDVARVTFSIRCFAEPASSLLADRIAGIVNDRLHKRIFRGTGYNIPRIRSRGLSSAVRTPNTLWRAEAFFEGNVFLTS